MINFIINLFRNKLQAYHPVTQWLEQGERGWHDENWGER